MRVSQVLAIVAVLAAWIGHFLQRRGNDRWQKFLPLIAMLFVIVHLLIDGFILEMALIYVLAAVMFSVGVFKLLRKKDAPLLKPGIGRTVFRAAVSLYIVIAVALPAVFPILPEPTGANTVASIRFEWIDRSRPETFAAGEGNYRDLMVTVWYPAGNSAARVAQTGADETMVPVSDRQSNYPVLVFSHGFGMCVDDYSAMLKDIASHGWVVFGIDHPYEASAVRYPDGRTVVMSSQVLDALRSADQQEANRLLGEYQAAVDPEKKAALFKQYDEMVGRLTRSGVETWTADTVFTLNNIEALNGGGTPGAFSGRLDMNRVGVFGHSFGGTIAGMACLRDSRFKAGLNMDGQQFGQIGYVASGPIHQPFMEMTSEDAVPGFNDVMYDQIDNTTYRLHIAGARHNNFTDMPLYAPLLRKSGAISCGSINPYRMRTIVDGYCLAFFGKHLNGVNTALLDGTPSDYREVTLRVKN